MSTIYVGSPDAYTPFLPWDLTQPNFTSCLFGYLVPQRSEDRKNLKDSYPYTARRAPPANGWSRRRLTGRDFTGSAPRTELYSSSGLDNL